MSTYVIIGGHGKVALQLAETLAAKGHVVRSTIRNEAHGADVEAVGAVPFTLDIEAADAGDVAEAIGDADAVVFSAGAGGRGGADRTRAVDLQGALKAIAASPDAGRFVMVSAIGMDEPLPDDTADGWRAYVESKRDADAALRGSGLRWTIVRPGTLTDDPGTGRVTAGTTVEKGSIARADVATVLAAVIEDDSTVGKQFELVAGDTAIPEAVASLA